MIMGAGFGKRMLPITLDIPKPIVKINDKSIIDNILIKLYAANINKIVINIHYLAEKLKFHVNNLEISKKLDITFIYEEEILETGGGVVNALNLFDNKPFFRINSDIFWNDLNLIDNLKTYWREDYAALLGVMKRKKLIGYQGEGDFQLVNRKYIKLKEKKTHVFSGIGIFSPKLFKGFKAKNFTLFQDFIFKDKVKIDFILDNIYGKELNSEVYHIDNVNNLEKFREILKS